MPLSPKGPIITQVMMTCLVMMAMIQFMVAPEVIILRLVQEMILLMVAPMVLTYGLVKPWVMLSAFHLIMQIMKLKTQMSMVFKSSL